MPEELLQSSLTKKDENFEQSLRPQSLPDFVGQEGVCERLEVMIGAAKLRGEPLSHCLFSGPPGLGKTTLAIILAKSMGTNLVTSSGPAIEKAGDLAGLLTSLKEGDVLFVDEIHRLNRAVEEYLYAAMEDFFLDLIIDSGPAARTVQLKLNRFTLVGATTRVGLLTAPLRSRFTCNCRLDYYKSATLESIVKRAAHLMHLEIDTPSAAEIAQRARGTPRIANNLLRWVRDFAQMRANGKLTRDVVQQALAMVEVDEKGLDAMDKQILTVIADHFDGGPVGLNTIATAVGEESQTIEEVNEPYLIMQGFLKRTPRGREITARGWNHLEKSRKEKP